MAQAASIWRERRAAGEANYIGRNAVAKETLLFCRENRRDVKCEKKILRLCDYINPITVFEAALIGLKTSFFIIMSLVHESTIYNGPKVARVFYTSRRFSKKIYRTATERVREKGRELATINELARPTTSFNAT